MAYSIYYIAIRNAILEIKKPSFGEAFIYVGTKPFLIWQFNKSEFSFEHASNTGFE